MSDAPDLFAQIQSVLAGHSEKDVMQALLHCLLVSIGTGSPNLKRAEAMIDALPANLKPLLRAEWPKYQAHRARMHGQPVS